MSKKTGKGAKWIGNTVGRRVGKETADALKKLTKEAEKKTGKKSSSSSDKVEKAARTVKEALKGVGDNAGRNVAELTSRHRGRTSGRGNTSSKMDKLTSNSIKTEEKENKSFAERFREDLKDGAGSNLREARRQYKPEEDPKKELETNLEVVNRKYRNAGVGGFANRANDNDRFNFQSAVSKQRMASTADRMIAEWDSIPENERVSVAEYIVQAYGINDKTRDIVMSAYQNADTNGKLQLLKTARYIDGESADVKKMQRMAQNAGDFEKAVESDLKNTSNTEKVEDFVRNAQKAVINDYRKEEEKTKLLQDWAKDNYGFSDAMKNQIYQSGSGWLAHAYDAVVMAWSDLVMAGQQGSVFDGIDPTKGMKDVRSIGDGLATAGSNVLHDLFRIAGLPISLISKASYTEEEAREITEKLMSVTDWYHDTVRETQLKLDGSGLSSAQKDIVEVIGAVIDQVPAIAMSVAATPAAGLATSGVEAGGMYARSAYDNGATLEDAVRFGLSAAAMEMVTEKMFTGFGYMGKGFLSGAAQDTIKNMLRSSGFENSVSANILRRVIAGGGEATEEMVMEIVQPYLERASYDPNAAGASMDEILHSGALGFVVAEILGLPANALGVANAATRKRNENQAERMVQDQIDDMMQDAIRRGKLSESEASNINAQIKDIRTKKGVLTESQAEQETKTTEDNLDKIYPDFNSARKAMQEEARNMVDGKSISAYFMQDGEVKVWRSVVADGKIGLAQEGTLTESERKSYADKAARVASAANATERTGYQLNVKDDIVKQVSALSRAFGKEIEFVNRDSAVHGYEENGKIYVNADSSQSPAAAVVAHEMTHMLEGTDSYAALRDMVYKHYGSSVGSKRDEILRNYENAGVTLDTTKNEGGYDEVDTEVMAAFVEEKLLTDYDTILSTVKTDRTLGERILDWLERVLTRIAGTKEQRFLIDARKKWSRALEEAREENKKAPVGVGEERRHAISKEEQKQEETAFISEIEAWNREGKPDGDTFVLGSTGEVLQGLGAIESDIYMKSSKVNTILNGHPEMTLMEIKKIPQILNDPIMILKSRNVGRAEQQNSRLVIFGSIKAQNGKPVLTVLDLKPVENHLVIDDMQKVTSAYTKTNNPVDFVRSSHVLYMDNNKKRAASLLRSIGFQMPIELQRVGSVGSISYKERFVNISGEPFSKIVKNSSHYSIGESEQKRIAELEASLKETKEVPVYSNGAVTFYIENSNGKYRFTKDKKNALALDRINKDKERELLSSQYKSKPLSMVRTEEVTVDARMSYDKRKGIQDEIEALKTGYANRQEMADAKNKKYQERIAADQRIAEESYFSEKERKGEPFYTDTAGFSYISALRTITAEAKRMGAEEVYASSKKGSKFSSSVYLKKDGVEIRISDHQLPDTMEREDPRYRTRWDDEIILNQSSLRELAREIKTQDDLKRYISQMFFGDDSKNIRYSIGTAEDAAYLEAVEHGDMEAAQEMVDEAAKAAGYDTQKLYHGGPSGIREFITKNPMGTGGLYLSSNKSVAEVFAGNNGTVYSLYTNLKNPYEINANAAYYDSIEMPIQIQKSYPNWKTADTNLIAAWARKNGYDSVVVLDVREPAGFGDDIIVFNPNQVKSADPVVYDDSGDVIPLSERFKEDNDDIRYSIGYTKDNEPFVEVDRDILDGVPRKDWVKTVKNNLRDHFPDGVHVGNEIIKINKQSRQEMTYSEYTKYLQRQYPNLYRDKLRATDNADEIIKASRNYVGEGLKHPRNDKIIEFAYGTVLLRIGDSDYSAKVVVGTQKNNSLLLYDIIGLKPTVINKKSQAQGKADNERDAQNSRRTVPDTGSISNSSSNVKKKFSIGTSDLKVDKETRDLITAHNAAMREVFYSRSRSDRTELWNMIKDEMAHILKTGASRRKVVDDIVQLAYDTGYRNATRENEAVNTWGKGIYIPERYMGEMASLGGLKAVNNQLMGSGLYFTYQRKKKDNNVNYGSLDEAYSDLSNANPMLPETIDPAEQVQAIIDLFSSKNRRQSLRELDEEAYEMGEDSEPYLTDIRNAVNEAMDDISTMARYKMTEAARKSGKTEGRKEGAAEQRRKQQKSDEATMREYDKLRRKIARDERRDAEATMRMHDKLIEEVRREERNLSEKEKSDIRREVKAKEREWDKEVKRQAAEFKREQRRQLRNADKNLDAALREAEKERKKREKDLSDAEKKEAQKRMKEIDAERRKERIETAKEEYRRNNPPPKTGTTADLYRKNNGARKIATDFRDKAIAELVNRGVFVDANGQVVLDENNQEVAYRSDETGKWDISRYKNSYTPSWGLTLLAKKEGLDVDKFYTIYSQIMTMRTEQDDRGNHKHHKSDIVKYIGTLDITAKQKDFLYFDCAKYAYSTKPNFLPGGKTKVKAGNRRGHMIEALDNITFDMFNGTVKQEEMIDEEVNIQLRAEDITAFLDAVFGKDPSAEKEAYAEFFTKLVIDSASEMELMRMAERSNLLTDKPKEISQTKSRILQIYRQSKRMLLAEGEAYERMSDDIGDKLLTARYYGAKNALAIANEMIYGNTQRDLSGINKGKSLHEIFRPVFRADEKANNHTKMVALTELVNCRHDIYRLQYDKGYTGYSIEECEEVVERISNEFPELVKVADELVEYGRLLLRMCVDSGRISEEDYQYFVEKYPYYVPTFRVRSNEYIDRKGRVVRRDTKVIRTAQKSNVDVLPLFDQFVRRTQEIVKACKKNQLANELARAYTMDETRGSEETKHNHIEKYIYNISPADKDNAGDLQSQIDEISEIGEIEDRGTSERGTENNVIPWYSNGVKYNIEIADEGLLYGWDRISYRKDEIALGTAVRKLNNIRRGVLTQYSPTFWLTNGIRDIQDMYMYNQHAQRLPRFHAIAAKTMFTGSLSGTKAAKKMTKREIDETRKNEERLQEYFSFGVRASSIFEYDKTKSGVRSRGRRAIEGVKKYTVDAFEGLNFMVEQTPRFAVYLETVDRLKKQREKGKNSYTDEEIKTIASYQATDATLNFGRSGTIVKGLNTYGFTFLNAGVQGMDRFVRSFTQIKNKSILAVLFNLAGLAFKVAFFGFAPGFISQIIYGSSSEAADAIRRALYGDDDDEIQKIMQEYAEMADYQKINYFLFYVNGTWYRIPRGRVLSWYNGIEFYYDKTGRDDYDILDFISDQWDLTTETILPNNPITNNILSPLIDVWRNKDNWGNDIVSEYEDMGEGMHYLEYDEDTTDLAIRIARLGHYLTGTRFGNEFSRIIDISPKKLDYVVEQYFGSYADMIMPFLNKEQRLNDNLIGALESMAKKFYIDPNASNRLAGDYYDLKDEYERISNAYGGETPYAVASKVFNDYGDFLKEARDNIKVIENDNSLTREERLEKISAIRKEMNQLYRDAMADAKSVLEYAQSKYGQEGVDNSKLYDEWVKENKDTDWRTAMSNKTETEKLNRYRNLGMSDDTAYLVMDTFSAIKPLDGKDEVTNYQKMEAIAGLNLSPDQERAAVGAALTSEKQYAKYLAMCDHVSGVSAAKWCEFQDALVAADAANNGNGSYDKEEKEAALNSCNFTNAERAVFWQSLDSKIGSAEYTTQWKAGRNPYDPSVAAKMVDSYLERVAKSEAGKAAANDVIARTTFPVGTEDCYISSQFGYRPTSATNGVGSNRHKGIDISTRGKAGVPAYSTAAGEVVAIGEAGGYGNRIIIQNDDGYSALYGHLASYASDLKVGDKVESGQQIGIVGNTGNSTGIHLHFEVRTNWEDASSAVDPNTVYDIDGDGKLKDGSVTDAMGTGTANSAYTGSGNAKNSSGGKSGGSKSGGGSKKASSSANLATALSSTQHKTTNYDSITKTASSRQGGGVYLPTTGKTVSTARSNTTSGSLPKIVRGRSTKAEGYGSGGIYLPRAKAIREIHNRPLSNSLATTKRTGRTGGSMWDENILG